LLSDKVGVDAAGPAISSDTKDSAREPSYPEDVTSKSKSGTKQDFPGLGDRPYWGKRDPASEYWYTDRDMERIFVVGRFTYPASRREDYITSFFNGVEWIRRVPETWERCRPLYNLHRLYDEDTKALSKQIVVVENEKIADALQEYFDESSMAYLATTWNGDWRGLRKTDWESGLRDREIILWPNNARYSNDIFDIIKGCAAAYVGKMFSVAIEGADQGWGALEAVAAIKNNVPFATQLLRDILAGVEEVPLETPITEINEDGIGHLETPIPFGFIEKLKDDLGEQNAKGKKVIPSSFISCMRVVSMDPAFNDFLKYDEAVADVVWDKSKYATIDDLKNAILRRLSQYGIMSIGRQIRDDIVLSLSNDPNRRINSVKNFFDELCRKHNSADESALSELMKHINVQNNGDDISEETMLATGLPHSDMYRRALKLFFTKACLRLYTAYSNNPIPNDIVPVFIGKQGVGKTRLCKYLAMTASKYVDLGNKSAAFGSPDWVRHIMGMFVAELGEMHVMRKSEVETIKSGISEVYDSLTPKFKEGVKRVPRTVSFVGTSNETEFLRDLSGNRRFYPLAIESVDHEYLFSHPEIIERVWAYFYSTVRDIMSDMDSKGNIIPFARQPMRWMIEPDKDLYEYFQSVRLDSTDIGVLGQTITDTIIRMEVFKYQNTKQNYVEMELLEVAEKVYGEDNLPMVKDDFKKKFAWVLERLGYSQCSNGRGVSGKRVYRILKTSKYLLSRVISDKQLNKDF